MDLLSTHTREKIRSRPKSAVVLHKFILKLFKFHSIVLFIIINQKERD